MDFATRDARLRQAGFDKVSRLAALLSGFSTLAISPLGSNSMVNASA
jgi:hypothetical protein